MEESAEQSSEQLLTRKGMWSYASGRAVFPAPQSSSAACSDRRENARVLFADDDGAPAQRDSRATSSRVPTESSRVEHSRMRTSTSTVTPLAQQLAELKLENEQLRERLQATGQKVDDAHQWREQSQARCLEVEGTLDTLQKQLHTTNNKLEEIMSSQRRARGCLEKMFQVLPQNVSHHPDLVEVLADLAAVLHAHPDNWLHIVACQDLPKMRLFNDNLVFIRATVLAAEDHHASADSVIETSGVELDNTGSGCNPSWTRKDGRIAVDMPQPDELLKVQVINLDESEGPELIGEAVISVKDLLLPTEDDLHTFTLKKNGRTLRCGSVTLRANPRNCS